MDDIPTLHKISLPFLSILPNRLDGTHGLAAVAQVVEVLIGDDFDFDESFFEIAWIALAAILSVAA